MIQHNRRVLSLLLYFVSPCITYAGVCAVPKKGVMWLPSMSSPATTTVHGRGVVRLGEQLWW